MQTEPIACTTIVPTIQATESRNPTTQDGFCPAEPHVVEPGGFPPVRDATPLPEGTSRRVRSPDGGSTLPGERVAAYEGAATPTAQHTMGFKVVKRSSPKPDGLALTDFPNGACARLLSAVPPS